MRFDGNVVDVVANAMPAICFIVALFVLADGCTKRSLSLRHVDACSTTCTVLPIGSGGVVHSEDLAKRHRE